MSDSPTPETDAAEFYYDGRTGFVEIDFCRKLERERNYAGKALFEITWKLSKQIDEALKERDEASRERDDAIEELARVRRELVAANRGAETNAKVNQGLCNRLSEAERERDEARMELVIQRHELMRGQKEVIETLVKLRERLAAVTHPYKNEQKEEA